MVCCVQYKAKFTQSGPVLSLIPIPILDLDIGFGPTDEPQQAQPELDRNETNHPLPPPITHGSEGVDRDENDVVEEGNFLLMKPVDGEGPKVVRTLCI